MITDAKQEDLELVVELARECDRQEIVNTAPGRSMLEAYLDAFEISDPVFTYLNEGLEPLAVGGILPSAKHPNVGNAWIVSREEALASPKGFTRAARAGLRIAQQKYDRIFVLSGDWLYSHHRWLDRLGFKDVGEVAPYTRMFLLEV